MKKTTMLLLLSALVVSISACKSTVTVTPAPENNVQTNTSSAKDTSEIIQEGNILVAYFSWADNAVIEGDVDVVTSPSVVTPGNVAELAQWVQQETGGDLFSIQVTEPYSSDWDECLARGNEERSQNARPELKASVENIADYDVVFLGYPNWWYGAPMAVLSFIEQNDLSEKQIYLFCSHGTGGLAGSVEDIKGVLPENSILSENVFDVYEEDASFSQDDIVDWLEEIGYERVSVE